MENSKNFFRYHLSEDIVLDWFGQTVKGQKNVLNFIKTKVIPVVHKFHEARSTNKIGFRDTHKLGAPKTARRILRSASFLSPPRPTLLCTPKKLPSSQASTSSARRQIMNKANISLNITPQSSTESKSVLKMSSSSSQVESPRKRRKLTKLTPSTNDLDIVEDENDPVHDFNFKYLTAEGSIEFHRPSTKKIQPETKWQRPCKIHIAYDYGRDINDSCLYLIIYEGTVKCRRNLIADFEAEEPEN